MKLEMQLRHPVHGLCDTVITTGEAGKEKVMLTWKQRYGRTIEDCTIVSKVIVNPRDMPVIYKVTKDWYPSPGEAAKDLGITANTIRLHCQREFNPNFQNKFKYA